MRAQIGWWVGIAVLTSLRAQEAAPTAEALIRAAVAAGKAQEAKGWKFTYREEEESHTVDKNGKPAPVARKTYDVIMLEGDNYRKLVLIDGKPPDAKLQKKIDADLEKERQQRRARPGGLLSRTKVSSYPGVENLEKLFDSQVTGEETVAGRKAWRVASWFDEAEGVWLKVAGVRTREFDGAQVGSALEMTQGKHGEAWLLDELDFHFDTKFALGIRMRGESRNSFLDYKKFEVESKITME
jgi:hypothetical protein